ncbi:hypothetical protein LXA43DRAFT_902206 [Ganoderma leucocontextum]|nr:hypothetical protein LXA43DRAFT_902206 [Ganoderma leucocontextum]
MYAPQTLPVYPARRLSRNQFLHLWAAGIPVVITKAKTDFQGHWDPGYFIKHHGKLSVTPIDCETGQERPRMPASQFFASLLKASDQQAILKLKDWPPKADFKTTFGVLDAGFFSSVPMECADLVCKDGIYNLAAHFPEGAVAPDLGPKLYIAMGAKGDTNGTTKLHLDVTCAINLMMWSEDMTSERPGAEWQIFPADSVEKLQSFLREEFSLSPDEDPIHQQHYYLSHVMLARLRESHGVSPWTIYQYYGDAVFIPAGCPHQVRNLTHAIKAACDFVSPQNLTRTINLASSLRAHRIASGSGEDLLQIQTLAWFGWMAMCTYEDGQAKREFTASSYLIVHLSGHLPVAAGTSEPPSQGATFTEPIISSTQPEAPSDAVSVHRRAFLLPAE